MSAIELTGSAMDEVVVQQEGVAALLSSLTSDSPDFYQAWLDRLCAALPRTQRAVLVLGQPESGPFQPVCLWPPGQGASAALAEIAEQTLKLRQSLVHAAGAGALVSCPILIDDQLFGLVAVETVHSVAGAASEVLPLVLLGRLAVEARLRFEQSATEQATRERLISTLDMVASVLVEEGFEASARAVATDLAIRLDCDRVSIGFVRDQHTEVIAVSHSADFGERMNLIRAIGTAMDESIDQRSIILQPDPAGQVLITRDHEALARQFGSDCVLTVPFALGDTTQGAFTFERSADHPFAAETIELCQAVVALCSRVLEIKRQNERLLLSRIKDAGRAELNKLAGERYFGRKLLVGGLLLALLFFTFAFGEHRVRATATLEGYVRRVLVAPYDGFVASAPHRAGDVVKEGEVLAALDDRDLNLEYYKWSSQRAQYSKQYQESMAQHDRAQSNITLAQVQQAEAQMNLIGEQLSRTQLIAPFAGIVVSGDLTQSLGSSVKRGQVLFEVAPLNSYRVILNVDEADVTSVEAGQSGSLVLASLAGEVFPLTVMTVTPVALAREGRSYFRVEALLGQVSDSLRPGMEGVAKIDVGSKRLIWIWTHRLVDWLRLTLWSWL